MDFNIYEYYEQVKNQNILISFKGPLSQEILVEMGDFIKHKVGMDKKLKKIFSVFVELAQNIMHYSVEREEVEGVDYGVGIIIFIEKNENFFVYSGNLIENQDIERIKNRLDGINKMESAELKKEYSKQLKEPQKSNKKGAGLGWLEIARKSNGPIVYEFVNENQERSFLGLRVKINRGGSDGKP